VTLNLVPRVSRLLFLWGGKIRDPGDQVECPQMFLPALNGIQISRVLIFTLDFFSLITKNFKKIKKCHLPFANICTGFGDIYV